VTHEISTRIAINGRRGRRIMHFGRNELGQWQYNNLNCVKFKYQIYLRAKLVEMKIITWNMDYWKRTSEQRQYGFKYLQESITPDIALLQEIIPDKLFDQHYSVFFHDIGNKNKWGSATLTKFEKPKEIFLSNNYPGSNGVIVVEIKISGDITLTVINIYGKIDSNGYASTTMHHILSGLTPILHSKHRYIILGGDFNVSEQCDEKYNGRDPSHKLIFDRLEDFGLINCTKKFYNKHIQTHVHERSNYEWQNDYLFISKNLEPFISKCDVINNIEMKKCSDHLPVVIELNFNINPEVNKTIYEGDPKSLDPFIRWGSSMSVMRSRAFDDYERDYSAGEKKWPEFKKEFLMIKSNNN